MTDTNPVSPAHYDAALGTVLVPLTRGYAAVIDVRDAPAVLAHRWRADVRAGGLVYAKADIRGEDGRVRPTYLHRFLAPEYRLVHHRDGDGLNNRRRNLVACPTGGFNYAAGRGRPNRTGHRGVSRTRFGSYEARISVVGHREYLGTFATLEEAARAYDVAAREAFGKFAPAPNIPEARR